MKIILNKQELEYKYKVERMSQKRLAEYYNCSIDTIVANLRRYNIKPNTNTDYYQQKFFLSNSELEWIDGMLLGDGSLMKNRHNINAQLGYTSKSKQHVDFATKPLLKYANLPPQHVSVFDKRTNKVYERYVFRTRHDKSFENMFQRWYSDGIKHIPEDLVLTPTICLLWYIGDGCLLHSQQYSYSIKLSTNCFQKDELENILIPQLKQFNAHLVSAGYSKHEHIQQYYISIPRSKVIDFLNYIGDCPFDDYKYKWAAKPYKNKPPTNHRMKEQEICKLYLSGMSYYKVAKYFSIDPSLVRYYLIKNDIYKKGIHI